jgi:hypothetical protein
MPAFHKELGDLRQDEIQRMVERAVLAGACEERGRARTIAAAVLRRFADRLERPADRARERARVLVRQP